MDTQVITDKLIDVIGDVGPYDLCPCGCGMKFKFAVQQNAEQHIEKICSLIVQAER